MDYKRLIYFLFENFIALSALIMTILMVILKYKRKLKNTENRKVTDLQDIKPDQIKRAPNNLSDIGMTAGWIILTFCFLYFFSVPVLCDVPYLLTGSYVEYGGTIVQNSEKGITVEVAFENDEPEKVEISGAYNLQEGEKIILEYLPHMKMRMNWYVSDTDSFE